jgi:hypothetical protein
LILAPANKAATQDALFEPLNLVSQFDRILNCEEERTRDADDQDDELDLSRQGASLCIGMAYHTL